MRPLLTIVSIESKETSNLIDGTTASGRAIVRGNHFPDLHAIGHVGDWLVSDS